MSLQGQKKFITAFTSLNRLEQDFLKVLATAFEPMSTKNFYRILTSANIYDTSGRTLTSRKVDQLIPTLQEKGWLQAPSLSEFYCNSDQEKELLKEAVRDNRFPLFVMAIRDVLPAKERSWMRKPRNFDVCIRELQIAVIQKDKEGFTTWLDTITQYYPEQLAKTNTIGYLFNDPFDPQWIATFPDTFQYTVLEKIIFSNLFQLKSIDVYIAYLEGHKEIKNSSTIGKQYRSLLGNAYIFQGQIIGKDAYFKNYARMAWVAFLSGDNKDSIELYEKALTSLQQISRKSNIYFHHAAGPFYILALLKRGRKADYPAILNYCLWAEGGIFTSTYPYLSALVHCIDTKYQQAAELMIAAPKSSFDWLIKAMVTYWMGETFPSNELNTLKELYKKAQVAGFQWMQMEFANVLAVLIHDENEAADYEKMAEQLAEKTKLKSIINTVKVVEKWEQALDALSSINTITKKIATQKSTRLIWLIDIENEIIQPKEQTLTKTGGWSKGRNAALKRLVQADLECMNPQDHRIAGEISSTSFGYYGSTEYKFDFKEAIRKMADHPYVFRHDNPAIPIDLIKGKPELWIDKKGEYFEFHFAYPIQEEGITIVRETPTRYIVIEVEREHAQVAEIIGKKLRVPKEAKDQVLEAINSVGGLIEVQSSVFSDTEDIEKKEGDPTIHVHLLPYGDGIKLELFTKPLSTIPPYYKPGIGRTAFVTTIGENKTLINRNLELENNNLTILKEACPTLQGMEVIEGEYTFEEDVDCLQVLLELEPLRAAEQIIIEWPKGQKIRLSHQVGLDQLSMRIQRNNDWFGITGKLQLEEDLVMDMRQLLDLLAINKDKSFVEIKDGQYMALTESFKARMGELNSLLMKGRKNLEFHPLAAVAMDEWADQLGELQVDVAWNDHISKLKKARLVKPVVPNEFQATLRPYQVEGYHWLSQLANWGVGACLADDMGLGKTIQTLALLVARGKDGPAFVVAPASVASNWRKEIQKFAPTLTPVVFGPGNRRLMLRNLKPNDVLITSYGLLQYEGELLKEKLFTTIVLDEAQAIKNRAAKRSRAAMRLQGEFKIITTGTPIENHLGELWNLFRFLNPGLLGTVASFQEKFAIPIEKNKDPHARQALKRLIQPFILRRKKDDVLKDLPSKTEITLSVALSKEESAFYEALRQKAVTSLQDKQPGQEGQQRFQILAEIMRLRQACCHPKLVTPNIPIESSKLQLLGEVLSELLETGHKALVFSQFVGHLKIIETYLQEQNISYQYLDGSTSMKKRETRIDAFQAGEGDVFLISLKAGGVGLNLTAADYVIHMDPWWNPAVEDQASDRAHRIGQKRPVTIYRLITENTIEEKIVRLHEHKRDLADSLLEGTDSSGKLSAEALLELIREQ